MLVLAANLSMLPWGDLVACRNLLDGRGVGFQLHGDAGQTHAVVAPGKDLVVLVDGHNVVKTRGHHGQLAHLGTGRNVFEFVGGESAPLVDVAVLIDAHREGAARGDILGVVLQGGGDAQHAEARGHVGLGDILIVHFDREEEGQDHAAQEDDDEGTHADHGDLVPDEAGNHHPEGALHELVVLFLLGHTAHNHALGGRCCGGFPAGVFLFLCHSQEPP